MIRRPAAALVIALCLSGTAAADDDDKPAVVLDAEMVAPAAGGTTIGAVETDGFDFLMMRLGLRRSFFSLEVPLLLAAPSEAGDSQAPGGFIARVTKDFAKKAKYGDGKGLSILLWAGVGVTRPELLTRSFYNLPPANYLGDLAPSFQAGFDEIGNFDNGGIGLHVVFNLEDDLAGEAAISGSAAFGFWRALSDKMRIGARFEARTGTGFSFDNDAGAQLALQGHVAVQATERSSIAVRMGMANLAPPDPQSAGDTLYFALGWEYAAGGGKRSSRDGGGAPLNDSVLVASGERIYGISSRLSFPAGPVETGAMESFEWVGFDLELRRKWLSISMPTVFRSPLFSEPSVGAVIASGRRHLGTVSGMALGGHLRLGTGRPRAFAVSDYGLIDYTGNFHGGGALGLDGIVGLDKRDRLLLSLGVGASVQLDSAISDDPMTPGERETHVAVQFPMAVTYAASERTRLGMDSGFYSGPGGELDSEGGLEIPAVIRVERLLGEANAVSLGAGFANVSPPEGQEVGDSLFVGLRVRSAL